jgi:hypothetical protein
MFLIGSAGSRPKAGNEWKDSFRFIGGAAEQDEFLGRRKTKTE